MRIPSDPYSPPRIITPIPPEAAGTLADIWIPWIESPAGPGIKLREWQRVVLRQALAVDSLGRFIFRDIVVSTPRQQGKGWLAYALAVARCQFAASVGEMQTVLHIANNLQAARRIHSLSWRWAEECGLQVRRGIGIERVIWPDGSSWDLASTNAVWGATASIALADEAWDMQPEIVLSALQPTLVEREQSQLWLTSTANEACTVLMPDFRRRAIDSTPRTMIAEWSAPPDADLDDPEVWIAATPHWSPQRGELMAAARFTNGFRYQWLNMWPDAATGSGAWLPEWDELPRAEGDPRFGIGAVETSADRSVYGAAVGCRRGDGTVDLWTFEADSLDAANNWLASMMPSTVLAGESIKKQVLVPAAVCGVGIRETRSASPVMQEAVRRRLIRHDGGEAVSRQAAWAKLSRTEAGDVLSSKASAGPIPILKSAVWVVWTLLDSSEEPEIW